VRTELVVVPSPALYFVPGILQRHKPVHIQTFVPETAVERFDMRVVRRCPWTGIIQLDLVEVRPGVQRPGNELRPVIDLDSLRQPAGCLEFFKLVADLLAFNGFVHVDGKALPAERVQHRQSPEPLSIVQLIGYEVHAPTFVYHRCQSLLRGSGNADLLTA